MASNLAQRLGFAAVAIPLALGVVWLGGWPLAALVTLVAVLGVRELFDIARAGGNTPLRTGGMVLAAVVPLAVQATLTLPGVGAWLATWWAGLLGGGMALWLSWLVATRAPSERPLAAISITLFAVAYAGALPSFLLWIRHAHHGNGSWAGTAMVFFPLVIVWVCDSAAMFGGKAIGGPKLAPTISPGKTRSGAISGLVGGVATALVLALLVLPRAGVVMTLAQAALFGLVLSVIGQLGDLAESLFKREAGVKDSSSLIPGHGGVLDRFDALYVALPVAAICYQLVGLL